MELKTSARMDQLAPSGIRKVNEKALAMERALGSMSFILKLAVPILTP